MNASCCVWCFWSTTELWYELLSVKVFGFESVRLIDRKRKSRKWNKDLWNPQRERCHPSNLLHLHWLGAGKQQKKPRVTPCLCCLFSVLHLDWLLIFQGPIIMRTTVSHASFLCICGKDLSSQEPLCAGISCVVHSQATVSGWEGKQAR